MHVPISYEYTLSMLWDRAAHAPQPEPSFSSETDPAPVQGLVPLEGGLSHEPTPSGGLAQGASCSWDPAIFRPASPVSCYSREIFSGESSLPDVSGKPGLGFKKPECGRWVRKLKSGDEFRDIFHNCGNLGCPACFSGTLTDKARDVEARFDLYNQAKIAENAVLIKGEVRKEIKSRQFIFTISPAKQAELIARVRREYGGWDAEIFLDILRSEFNQGLKLSGLIGGFTVYHDARVRHPDTETTGARAKHLIKMEAMCAENMTDSDPSWKIYDHIRKQKNWNQYYYFSPHFHVIAFGKAEDIEVFEKLMPGWTYHNKGPVDNPGGLARYLFSHMALLPNRKSCSWFGRLSSKKLGKTEIKTYDRQEVHPVTGVPWVIVESVVPAEIGSIYTISVTEYLGFFRGRQKHKKRDPNAPVFPPGKKRSMAPPEVHERGILAMAQYCDEWGKL